MKIKLVYSYYGNEDYYHLYLNGENIGYQNKSDTINKVVALIKMSDCDIEINKQEIEDKK